MQLTLASVESSPSLPVDDREDCWNCSELYCASQLYAVTNTHMNCPYSRGVRLAKNDFGSVLQKTAVFGSVSVITN